MSTVVEPPLRRLDFALGRLRRVWESPALRRRFTDRMGASVEPGLVRTLRTVELADDECGVTDVAALLKVDASTASRLVEQAVCAGYLVRSACATDRRRCVLAVTDTGAELLGRALHVREELLAELTEGWSDTDVDSLAELLCRLADRLVEMETRR